MWIKIPALLLLAEVKPCENKAQAYLIAEPLFIFFLLTMTPGPLGSEHGSALLFCIET